MIIVAVDEPAGQYGQHGDGGEERGSAYDGSVNSVGGGEERNCGSFRAASHPQPVVYNQILGAASLVETKYLTPVVL